MKPSKLLLETMREILDGRMTKKMLPSGLTEDERTTCERTIDLRRVSKLPKINKWLEQYERQGE